MLFKFEINLDGDAFDPNTREDELKRLFQHAIDTLPYKGSDRITLIDCNGNPCGSAETVDN